MLAGLTSLRHLHLKATPISEDGAAVLLSLPCLWRLECSWRGREEALVQLGQQLLDRHGHSVLAGYPPAT